MCRYLISKSKKYIEYFIFFVLVAFRQYIKIILINNMLKSRCHIAIIEF